MWANELLGISIEVYKPNLLYTFSFSAVDGGYDFPLELVVALSKLLFCVFISFWDNRRSLDDGT